MHCSLCCSGCGDGSGGGVGGGGGDSGIRIYMHPCADQSTVITILIISTENIIAA